MTEEKNVRFEEIIETPETETLKTETPSEPKLLLVEEDYKRILEIINVATKKGAFTADEMYITGLTYERVKKHMVDNYPNQNPTPTPST